MRFEDWTENIIEETEIYLACVKVDLAGGTELWKYLDREEIEKRKNFYRQKAEDVFSRFGAVRTEWHGDGCNFFFGNQKTIEEDAVKSSIELLTQLKIGIEGEIPIRISINSGITKYKKELGKMDDAFLDFCGHLNSACPENSILIAESIYFALFKELKEKFTLSGTAKRDNIVTFIYPKEKKLKKNVEYFLPENQDDADVYIKYLESLQGQCKSISFPGIKFMARLPVVELTKIFFPLKLRPLETFGIDSTILTEDAGGKRGRKKRIVRKPIIMQKPYNFLDIHKDNRHLVILGDPGSGKTTLLKWLCLLYSCGLKSVIESRIDDEVLLPVLVPISAIYIEKKNQEHISPIDAISKYYDSMGIRGLNRLLDTKLENGRCIVLLDGIDEIPESKDRFSIARYIENFIRRFEKNRFIMTSRILGYTEIKPPTIKEFSLCSLDEKDIIRFITNWFTEFEKISSGESSFAEAKAKSETEQLLESIKQDKHVRSLASNPFLLTLICLIQRAGRTLPRYRVELYRLCVETLFATWPEARSINGRTLTKPKDYREGEKVLAPLSLWMHEKLPGGIGNEEMIRNKIIEIKKERGSTNEEATNSANEFFEYLTKQTQIIIQKGGDYYGFMHLAFEEFLSARAIIMNNLYKKYIIKYSYDPRWTEVFLLTIAWRGLIDNEEIETTKMVEEILRKDDDLEKILHKNLLLAGKIVAFKIGVKKDIEVQVITKIFELYIKEHYWTLRNAALSVLERILSQEDDEYLHQRFISILTNQKAISFTRSNSASALSLLAEKNKEIKALLLGILKDKNEDIWVRGRIAYSMMTDKEVVDTLINTLNDKTNDELIRGSAAFALSSVALSDKEITELLVNILKDNQENPWVRAGAADALFQIADENQGILALLRTAIKDRHEHEWVRESAAGALFWPIKREREILNELLPILKDKTESLSLRCRLADILAFALIEKDGILNIYLDIFKDEKEKEGLKKVVALALGNADKENTEIINLLRININKETPLFISSLTSILKLGAYNKHDKDLALKVLKKNKNAPLFNALWSIYS